MVSIVVPVWEMPIATSSRPRTAAEVRARWASDQTNETRPIRCSFWCRSCPTSALAPIP